MSSRSVFYDLANSQETLAETSKSNIDEARFTLSLIQLLRDLTSQGDKGFNSLKTKIGIITPYKSQVKVLKD